MMLRGLGAAPIISPTDQCLNLSNYTSMPCSGDRTDMLCVDQWGSTWGKCGQMPGGYPVPTLTLPEIIAQTPNVGMQVISAANCDPMVVAAGYLCSSLGPIANYTRGQKAYTAANGSQYDAPTNAQTLALTYDQAQWLAQNNLINPVSSPTQSIAPTNYVPTSYTSPPPVTSWNNGAQIQTAVPTFSYPNPIGNPILLSQPNTAAPAPSTNQTPIYTSAPDPASLPPMTSGGVMPGSNVNSTQSLPAVLPSPVGGESTILPGVANQTLYIAGGAILLLLLLKK